jgi:hypothetical protein
MKKYIYILLVTLSFTCVQICHAQSILYLSPSSGNAGQTLNVTITGCNTNFAQGSGTTSVNFSFPQGSSTPANSFTVVSSNSIIANVTIPANTYTGYYNVSLFDFTDGNLSDNNSFYVNGITPPSTCSPTITNVSPASGNSGQILNVTITCCGTSFIQGSGTTSVNFSFPQGSNTPANSFTLVNDTSLIANVTIPANTYTGYYNVSVSDYKDGTLADNNSFYVNGVKPPCNPTIMSVSPASGNSGQSLNVTITGCGTSFIQGSGTASVNFSFPQGSSTPANSITTVNDTSLIANVAIPANTYTGYYNVSVSDTKNGTLTDNNCFYVNGTCSPTITNVSPPSGNIGQTLNVTITGCGTSFVQGSGTTVVFSQKCFTLTTNSYSVYSDTTMSANITIPNNALTGYYNASVYTYTNGTLNETNAFLVSKANSVNNINSGENTCTIYPNPTTGKFTIQISNSVNLLVNSQIEIYNILGENIYQAKLNSYTTELNFSTKPNGIYLYRIISEKGEDVASGKFVIQ